MRCLIIAALLLTAPVVLAQPQSAAPSEQDQSGAKQRAKAHYERGRAAFQQGRYKDAVDAFLDAHREMPSPDLSFNAAIAYEKLGDTPGALRFFREYLRQRPDAPDRDKVLERVGELEAKLRDRGVQQVTIMSEPTGATVFVDGRPVGVTPWTGELYPGDHALRLRREGFEDAKQSFTLPTHKSIDVSATLAALPEAPVAPPPPNPEPKPAPAPPPPPPIQDTHGPSVGIWTWTAFGVGALALGGAVTFEILRARSEEDVKTERTRVARLDANDQMEGRQTTARILAGVGAAAVVTGGVLLYLDLTGGKSKENPAAASPRVLVGCVPGSCGGALRGTF